MNRWGHPKVKLNDAVWMDKLATRFWSKVDKSGGCWIFHGFRDKKMGYTSFGLYSGVMELSHRVAWVLAFGSIPIGKCVLHHCDNPPCVNPQHLWLGTRADNNLDKARKNRGYGMPGALNPNSIFSDEQYQTIKQRLLAGDRVSDVAHDFGVSSAFVARWRVKVLELPHRVKFGHYQKRNQPSERG